MKIIAIKTMVVVIFLCLGIVVSMDEYNNKLYEIEESDTLQQIIEDHFAKEKVDDVGYRVILEDMLKKWNPHISDWKKLPLGVKIYVVRPTSPFIGHH